MDTKTFLSRVTARAGEVVVCIHRPDPKQVDPRGIFWNRGSFADLDTLVARCEQWDAEPNSTVYFSVGTFVDNCTENEWGKIKYQRTAALAHKFKALALDLDIGADKPYQTQSQGWAALRGAIEDIGLPMPMLVSSGYGIHAYWPLTEEISAENWERISIWLRVALADKNVSIDTSKIHDRSMVLRPAGTHNKKRPTWKPVEVKLDCPDYDVLALARVLKPWAKQAPTPTRSNFGTSARPASSIAEAVLASNDVILSSVLPRCEQLRAIAESGGVTDANGATISEPMWRLTLGIAKYCDDQEAAIMMLAGNHPSFDLDNNMQKLHGWNATGPTKCETFDRACANVCTRCPHFGQIKSPASLSHQVEVVVESPGQEPVVRELPPSYILRGDKVLKEVTVEVEVDGKKMLKTETQLVSDYQMHITGVYSDKVSKEGTFRLQIKYPYEGWLEEDHAMECIAVPGKEFSKFLLNRHVYVKTAGQQEKVRVFLMDYLTMVQGKAPTGRDFVTFGWHEDGSFLCGNSLVGSPVGDVDRRLKGVAEQYANKVRKRGTREGWVEAMQMLNNEGTETIRSAMLIAMSGLVGAAGGNSTMVLSIYSTKSGTGKSLALAAANSLIGDPRGLFLTQKDTQNSLFKIRGTLNHLPCTIDELTAADDGEVVDLVYHLGQGRERTRLTKDADLREPAEWKGVTLVTTNISLYQKFDAHQTQNEGPRARTLELNHHDRTFVDMDAEGKALSDVFFRAIDANHGWAMPELAEAVIALGGPEAVWLKGEAAFARTFNFKFDSQDRYFRTAVIAGWTVATIGKKLGLIPFDVDETTQHVLNRIKQVRKDAEDSALDVFDTIGQFLQEHNHQLIEVTEEYGSNKEVVRHPAPESAVARVKIVHDKQNPVLPGSVIAINSSALKRWLARTKDGLDRVVYELLESGALINPRERVTMFKGVKDRNPGQAHCLTISANHPRFIQALSNPSARGHSPIALAVLKNTA